MVAFYKSEFFRAKWVECVKVFLNTVLNLHSVRIADTNFVIEKNKFN